MKIASKIWKLFLGIGVVAAIASPLVPVIISAFISLPTVKTMGDGLGQAFAIFFWWGLLALVAIVASIVALIAATSAHEKTGTVLLCGLPILLTATTSFVTWLFRFG